MRAGPPLLALLLLISGLALVLTVQVLAPDQVWLRLLAVAVAVGGPALVMGLHVRRLSPPSRP
ncbi:MAG TPA: hypothetical protein VNZ52_03610 [Candidatus Thermoplasmatota archaeon]|nr:hypothetical protein [Candidatus Thermoplasmatota archaeon]